MMRGAENAQLDPSVRFSNGLRVRRETDRCNVSLNERKAGFGGLVQGDGE